ncbi:MAG: hypothetical protein L6Q71_11105, partial [Planctomycetes bacterium]|nr:hypothetical protein [Planctomycetota bacterium]
YSSVKEIAAEGMTLTMRLDRPVAHLVLRNLAMFSASIVSPKLIQSLRGKSEQEAGVAMGSGAAGTGPFKIVNFDTSTYSVRLEAFEQYW